MIKDQFCEQISVTVMKVPEHDILLVLCNFNTKVWVSNVNTERHMGKHGLGVVNQNGGKLTELCELSNLVIASTLFPHKDIQKYTWVSLDKRIRNQIDHLYINTKFRSAVLDVRAYSGADRM